MRLDDNSACVVLIHAIHGEMYFKDKEYLEEKAAASCLHPLPTTAMDGGSVSRLLEAIFTIHVDNGHRPYRELCCRIFRADLLTKP